MITSLRLPIPALLLFCLLATFGMENFSWAAAPRVSAAGNHSAALLADGTIWGWGENAFGQVGDGSHVSRNLPVRIGADSDWSAIAAGYYHAVALKSDGTLWTWGDNTKGQLGEGVNVAGRSVPVKIGTATDWLAVAAGDFHTLALKTDHSLWVWGDNTSGQVGNGSVVPGIQPVPVRIGTDSDWTAIAAGGSHSIALKSDLTLWGWGSNAAGQFGNGNAVNAFAPVKIKLPAPFTDTDWNLAAAGQSHTAAIKSDGSLWSWGNNVSGKLGNGSALNSLFPVREAGNATSWVAVAAGDSHGVGRKADGSLWAWGGNTNGQLGTGTNIDSSIPVKVGTDTDWFDAVAGSQHSVALKANGTVWCWGDNSSGQLGDGTIIQKTSPVPIVFQVIAAVPATGVTITPSQPTPHIQGTSVVFTAAGQGSTNYDYRFWLYNGTSWTMVQDYGGGATWTLPASASAGTYAVSADVRTSSAVYRDAVAYLSYEINLGPASGVSIAPGSPTPHIQGTSVAFTAAGQGSANYDYRFWFYNGTSWTMVQDYGGGATWTLPASTPVGTYAVSVDVRTSSAVYRDAVAYLGYEVNLGPATGVSVTPDQPTPHIAGTEVVFTASGQGASLYDYRFWLFDGTIWTMVQNYGGGSSWILPNSTIAGDYVIAVDVRTSATVNRDAVTYLPYQIQ